MRAIDFLVEYQQLDEVQMSPSSLKLLVKNINATAGMEFEMIVPNVSDPDDGDLEPDMDADDRASSFEGIEDFFMGGNYDNYRPDVRRMIDKIREDFYEWMSEYQQDDWSNNGKDFLRDYIDVNDYFDEDEAAEQAIEELKENNPEIEEDSDAWHQYIRERVSELFDEFVDEQWDNQGRMYDNAYEAFLDDYDGPDEGDWLERNYKWMSDIYNEYGSGSDVFWPYTRSGGGEGDISQVAEDFSDAIGRPCNASSSYHGKRVKGEYTVEPDGSLDPDDTDDTGLEFVSPPLPLTELVEDLKDVVKWAQSYGCYTNESTGLHMNVSVPSYSLQKVDYTKLALLMGDEYVLKQFGREANTYTKSAMVNIRKRLQQNPGDATTILEKMRQGLDEKAIKLIHSGVTDKYTSINTKDGYIEFRSPGGDWLNEDVEKLISTLYRFVVAMDAACDPEKYKQEYYKKLYKLLNPDSSNDVYGQMINDFSQYVTAVGGAPQKVVADFRRLALATLKQAQGKDAGDYWWNVKIGNARVEVVGKNKQDAWESALTAMPDWKWYNINDAKIDLLRPFVDDRPKQQNIPATAGNPERI